LLAHIRWFSPGTPASTTNKTGRHDIVEILLKVDIQRLHSKGPHREMNDNINTHMDNTIAGSVNGQQDNDNHQDAIDTYCFIIYYNNPIKIHNKTFTSVVFMIVHVLLICSW
jgi:hypothetical protein